MADDESPSDETAAEKAKKKEPPDQKRREQILVGAAIVGVVLTFLLIRRSSANAAAANQNATPAYLPGTTASPGSYAGGDIASSDYYNLEMQVQGLSQQLSTLQNASGTSSPTAISSNPTPQTFLGAGWAPSGYAGGPTAVTEAPISGGGGSQFIWVPTPAAAQALGASGQPLYIEPTPGVFIKDPGTEPAGSAAQFVRSA
jgi:hypothetical protein